MVSFSEKDMSYQLFTHIKQFIYYIRIFFMLFLLACFSTLKHLYKGPKATESSLTLIHCQSSDAQIQSIQNGLIRVQLLGECGSCGSMSIYDSIVATLKQFPFIETVHVLDPQGNTQSDGDNIDARPACLNP